MQRPDRPAGEHFQLKTLKKKITSFSWIKLGKGGAEASFQEDFKNELAGCGGLFFQAEGHTGEVV